MSIMELIGHWLDMCEKHWDEWSEEAKQAAAIQINLHTNRLNNINQKKSIAQWILIIPGLYDYIIKYGGDDSHVTY